MRLLSLVTLLLAIVSCCFADEYQPLTALTPQTATLQPCEFGFWQVDTSASNSVNNYLSINVLSNVSSTVVVSTTEYSGWLKLSSTNATGYSKSGANVTLDVVCTYLTATTWFITIGNDAGVPISYTVVASIVPVPITPVTLNTVYNNPRATGYQTDTYVDLYDVYSLSLAQTANLGQTLIVDVTSPVPVNILYNTGALAANYGDNVCYNAITSTTTLTINYCTYKSLVAQSPNAYIAISPQALTTTPTAYSLNVTTPAPSVKSLTPSQVHLDFITPGQTKYYSFPVANNTNGVVVTAHIQNVEGGSVDFSYQFGELPFTSCLGYTCSGDTPSCCVDVDVGCQLVVNSCFIQDGTYYLGVTGSQFDSPQQPIVFEVLVNITGIPSVSSVKDGEFITATVSQSQYNHYMLEDSDSDDDGYLEFHLYVDQSNNQSSQVIMYVNYDGYAGSNGDSCYSSVAQCSVGNVGACTIQINPCLFDEHTNWYASVYAGSYSDLNQKGQQYTLSATILNPVELEEPSIVLHSVLYPGTMDHYSIDEDLLPEGGGFFLVVNAVNGGQVNVYQNAGGLAGPLDTCPTCYNYTEYRTTSQRLVWPVMNCNSTTNEDKDDYYFSVMSNNAPGGALISYSITVVEWEELDPSDDLDNGKVLVDFIGANAANNYTLESSSGSDSYLVITLTQVDVYSASQFVPLTLSLVNTTNANCADSNTYSESCTISSSTYECSIVVQQCDLTTSDGFVAFVNNYNNQLSAHYNLYYETYKSTPVDLVNGQSFAGSVMTNTYQMFSYESTGSDTLIIEVFFDKTCTTVDGGVCEGQLYVTTDKPNADKCIPITEAEYYVEDTTKCVFALTTCSLPEEMIYFAVSTKSELHASYPLSFTAKVTEMSSATAIQPLHPTQAALYPRQKNYHTFTTTANAPTSFTTLNVTVNSVQNGQVVVVLAEDTQASETCECFEFVDQLMVEYCDITSPNWAALVQSVPGSNTPANQLIEYTIVVGQFVNTPMALPISTAYPPTPAYGSLLRGQYAYYQLTLTNPPSTPLVLSVTNIANGVLTIFYSTTPNQPATRTCGGGRIVATGVSGAGGSWPLGNCETTDSLPTYITIFAASTTDFKNVTYSVSLLNTPVITVTTLQSGLQALPAGFTRDYQATLDLSTSVAPMVTFYVENVTSQRANTFKLVVSNSNTCESAAALHTVTCQPNANCSISISDCGLKASTNFYLVITSTTNTNYTVRVELVDLAASSIPLTLTQDPTTSVYTGSSSAQVSAGSFPWVTFTVTVPAAPGYSLELDVTSDGASGSLYSSFQEATPDCYIPSLSETNSFNAITQNACCSQAGTLSVAVYTAVAATINLDVTMTPVILPAVTLTATNAASDLVQNQPLAGVQPVMMPFSTQTVPYASVYMAVTLTDDTDDVYFKQGSPAGPTQGSGACLGSDFSCTRSGAVCYYNVPQCFTSGEPFQNPAAYYAGVDSSNPTTFNVTYGLAPYSAVNAGAQGNFAYVPAQPVYVTFTATNPSVEIDVSINVTYSDNAAQVYIYSGQCEQGTPLLTCSGSPCLFQTPSCSIPSDDFLVVVHTQSTTVGGTVTIDAGMVPNTIAYTAQSLDNGAVVAVSGNTNNYVTATVSKATATQYSELLISNYTGSVSGLTVYWTVQGQHLCFTEISVKVVCEVQQDLTNTCTAILSSCELIDGLYYFDIELSSSTATAQVSFVGLQTENTIPITALPAVQAGSVLANQRLTYSIELDVLVPQPGQSIELSLNNICGETSLYLYGDDNLCPVSSGKSYTIDKCSLLNSSAVNNQVNTLYFSVNGDAQSYPNSPARFVFEVALQGEPIAFVPVGTNELITYAPNTVWVFPISGISDFVGQLQFVYGQGVEGSHLVISFDVPTFCASPSETITFNSTFLYLNSCTIDKYRQVYISFADGSDGASFQITHARPFTRNLNDFTENPQTGAVAPSSNSVSQTSYFVDEEYYSLEVDSSVQNFQFAAWVSDDDDPTSPTTASTVRLQSSLVEPPSMCSTTNTQNAAWNRKVTWEWCQVGDNTPIYLTVNNPVATNGSPKAEARSYNLYFTTVLDTPPTELSANQPLCAPVMNKTTAYFHAVATSTATAHQKIRVSSVTTLEGTGALDVYISTGGLASATCNENANFGSQCNAVSNVCEFDLSCFTGGNISVAVVNGMTENASFYIEYISTPIQPLSITVNAATAVVIGANNGTAQTYYLMATVPTLAANQWLAVSATSPQSAQTAFTLWYSVGTMPGTECYEGMCTSDASGECALLVNSCTPPAVNQIIYIVVQSTGQFNVWVDVVSTTLNTLGAQQRVAGSFAVADYVNADTLHSMITKPLVYTYQITVSADDIANNLLGDMTIVVDSVNQGSIANPALLVWVTPATAGYFGDECVLDSALVGPSTPGALYVPPCQFTSGSYFVTVALNLDANLDGCTDVTFGIAYSFTKANPTVTNIDNVSVSANVPIGTSDQSFYSLSGNELTGVYVQVPNQVRFDLSYFRAPFALGASASCETYLHDSNSTDDSTITSFTQYWWGCTAHNTTSNLVLDVTGPPGLLTVLPGTQYTVTGVSQAIASLTSTPASYTFAYSFLTQQAYKFTIDVDDSAQINVQLTKGPSVHVELYSSTCDSNNENVLMTAMDCYAGLCKIPISWSAGDLDNNTVYYVVVSGYAPAAYSVSLLTGQSGTCVEPTNTTLCDVSWTVWNYGTGEAGFGLQDSAAIRMYQTLLNSFCPPCGCTEISSKCNSSLIEYVCTQSYRACDTTGLQTSVCEDTCADVENNCGVTFAEVGLPYLSCNHNFYYTEDDGSTVCEDIYDITQTDRKDQLLWLIALVVLVLVVLIILGVVGYLGYKKYKHGRQGNSYEKIKEPSSDDEVVDEIAVD